MGHKKHRSGPAPVPPGNQPHVGPQDPIAPGGEAAQQEPTNGSPFEEQDPQRRLGRYETAGEHSFVQPTGGRGNKDA